MPRFVIGLVMCEEALCVSVCQTTVWREKLLDETVCLTHLDLSLGDFQAAAVHLQSAAAPQCFLKLQPH